MPIAADSATLHQHQVVLIAQGAPSTVVMAHVASRNQRPRGIEQRLANRLQLVLSSSCAYVVLAILSTLGRSGDSTTSPFWLPAGLTNALALRVGYWGTPVALLGDLVNDLGHGGGHAGQALVLGLGHAGGTALVAYLCRRWMQGQNLFGSLTNLFAFLGAVSLGGLLSTVTAALVIPELRGWPFASEAINWWASDFGGSLILAPALVCWLGRSGTPRWTDLARPEFSLLLATTVAVSLVLNLDLVKVLSLRPFALLMPLTLWSAFRFSPAAATLFNTVLAMLLTLLPSQRVHLLELTTNLETEQVLQLLVIATLIPALVVLVVNSDRSRSSRKLAQQAASLERTVLERTRSLEQANAQLQRLSSTDGLTGLANRRHFDAVMQQEWSSGIAHDTVLAVALLDVDHFKAYNDHYGHPAGDRCLQAIAQALQGQMRNPSDCVARYGGEEFVVLWPGLTLAAASAIAERLRQAVLELAIPHAANAAGPLVSLSIGVAATHPRAKLNSAQSLIELADQRLYAAKAAGRNRVITG